MEDDGQPQVYHLTNLSSLCFFNVQKFILVTAARSSTVTLPSLTTQGINGVFGSKISKSTASRPKSKHGLISYTIVHKVMFVGSTEKGFFYDGFKYFCEMQNYGMLFCDPQSCIDLDCVDLGYAQHGFMGYNLRFFMRMELLGIKPNAVMFCCVLFSCSHGAMVEGGLHCFQLMEEGYSMVPDMDHYTHIIDHLGRVGRLNDALEFVEKKPTELIEVVWRTLLGACRIYGNVELGERAAKKILSIQLE
ncbi:hypothetical protein F0562_031519 [Nyssa sinensis]|uniref:Pentatricopeptide repeat-containing protein n=1 Tax=Nyssa sinensis TaxID=561372 RepID=A0A5J5AW51_9ASTE|nr:hypothetical protein F0562_031519 [Nyssa sinensis]